MALSKQERHEIYKMAKQSFTNEIKNNSKCYPYSMCKHIGLSFMKITNEKLIDYSRLSMILTEFDSLKPDGCFYSGYWWLPLDYEIRIEKFNELIEMTK